MSGFLIAFALEWLSEWVRSVDSAFWGTVDLKYGKYREKDGKSRANTGYWRDGGVVLGLKYFGKECAVFTQKRTRTVHNRHLVCNISNTNEAAPLLAISKIQSEKQAKKSNLCPLPAAGILRVTHKMMPATL